MMKTKLWKRFTAGMMVLVMTIVFSGVRGNAAEKQDVTYIKDFKLYIDENKDPAAVKDWFEKNGYTMIEGNLNEDASGYLKKEVGVYMGYSTTTNSKEAVTDLAVMNERGNYSVGEYKRILEEQKKMYDDMVSDLKDMLEEYRTNVNNEVATAIQARDFMNGYFDPDSKEKLGDLLMTISDDKLGTLLMQANGQVVLMIEDRLSYACDTGATTWLDRMTKLGSYAALEKKALKACNNDINKAKQALDKKYKEDALKLAGSWEDVRQHISKVREQMKSWGLDTMDEAQIKEFFESNTDNDEVQTFAETYQLTSVLARYSYEEKSLFDYFEQPVDTFNGDGIRKLYPLAASLSQGQISGVDQAVSLFTLIVNALGASAFNDYQSGETKEILDKMDSEGKSEVAECKENVEKTLTAWQDEEPISIYEGVDREVFDGGVAVTSTAHSFSNGDGLTWADALVNGWVGKSVAAGFAVGSVLFMAGAIYVSRNIKEIKEVIAFDYYTNKQRSLAYEDGIEGYLVDVGAKNEKNVTKWGKTEISPEKDFMDYTANEKNDIFNKAMSDQYQNEKLVSYYTFARKLKIGLTIACIVLAVTDIVTTSIALYKYYNREHLPIPAHMVDLSYNDKGETSFVNYKSVPDQKGECGDVNGGGGKQWLALYQTHDVDAGNPILAPENGEEFKLIVQYGSADGPKTENYTPLHLFGSPNTPQNLTFADGESGWSYNDGKKGTYVFFRRGVLEAGDVPEASGAEEGGEKTATGSSASEESSDKEAVSGPAADLGTATGAGTTVLVGALCGVAGILIGCGAGAIRRKKKDEDVA